MEIEDSFSKSDMPQQTEIEKYSLDKINPPPINFKNRKRW